MASRTTTDSIEKILVDLGVDLTSLAFEDSSEQDYLSKLREGLATLEFKAKGDFLKNPKLKEQYQILQEEFLKVRKGKKKPQAKKTKITAGAFKRGSATGTNVAPKALPSSAIVSYQKPEAEEKKEEKKKGSPKNLILEISETVTRIADILKDQYDLKKDTATFDRKKAERERRDLQKKNLAKRFEGLKKVAEKIIEPVRGIFDRIMSFLFNILLGKFLMKLVDWFANPENKSKVNSIIRFLTNNWPKLLSAYIVFGTGLGKFSRFIVKILARGAIRLAAATAGLLARLFGGRALGKFSRFLGRRGKLIAGGIEAVTTIFAFKALESALTKNLGPEESASIDNDIPVTGYSGGGMVGLPGMGGGGGGTNAITSQAKSRSLLSVLSDPFGNRLRKKQFNDPQNYLTDKEYQNRKGYEEGGEVDGPGGIDKVPAMLTDGEFVMSRGAVQKYGVSQLEAMNAAGGGTNVPKVMNGTVYAAGGGFMGDGRKILEREYEYISSGRAFEDLELRKKLNGFFGGTFGSNFNILNPSTWKMPKLPDVNMGGGLGMNMPNLDLNIQMPQIPNLGIGEKMSDVLGGAKERVSELPGMLKGVYDTIVEDPRVQGAIESIQNLKDDAIKKGIDAGYLNKDGDLSGAAKAQATNFLSDLFPLVPGMSNLNRAHTTKVLNNMGLSREKALGGDVVSQAMFTGASGIDRAHNVGAVQINKMSTDAKDYYLDKIKAGLAAGTLKSGDLITPYDLPSNHPIRREQGTVRFHVGPDGKPYLLDTYGFDPGEVELGSARAQYDEQVRKFQDPSTLKGKIAKMFDLKPMADATEGGGMAQYILAARNKLFGYDPLEEVMKGADNSMRFKNKAQIEELSDAGLGDLSRLVDQKNYEEVSILNDEEKKAFIAGGGKAALKTQSLNEVLAMGRNNIKEEQLRGAMTAPGGIGPTLTRAQLVPNQQPNISIPSPYDIGMSGAPNVTVIKTSSKDKSPSENTGGSEVPNANPGQGNRAKWNILGMSVPALF